MSSTQQPIAIVGVSALFPGSTDAAGFWRDILAGRDLLSDVPATHWRIEDYYDPDPSTPDKTYARRGGFLGAVDFDALGFGVPPSSLPATDTSQLLALIVAQQVLADAARERVESIDRSRISVILGVTSAQELLFSMVSRLQRPVWERALREAGLPEAQVRDACERIAAGYVPWQEASFPGLLGNVVAGRIANRLDLGGTNCVTDAACASSFSAISMAVNELQLGQSDLVISGGVDTLNDIFMYMCFSKTPALSPSGDCRPFSDQADGTMLGEGLGMVALKRLADAERDGDRIYAVLRGVGTSSDGRSKSVYAPVSAGQAQALRRAYELAGYGPKTVELVEAHGTGTKAGDIAEFEGLRLVFDADGDRPPQSCALGSVKSQIGHTKAAAGAAGLFKVVMALQHRVLPPTIKVDAPNPKLEIERSAFYLNTQARPWVRGSDHPRRASVSAFGFGGSNFHLTLEEYTGNSPKAERLPMHGSELVLLQGEDALALRVSAEAMLADTRPLAHVASESRRDWNSSSPCRLALVARDAEQLAQRLRAALTRIDADQSEDFTLPDGSNYGVGALEGKLAALFPGQGSQYLGMGSALAMQFDAAQGIWDAAADQDFNGERLQQRVFPRPVFNDEERATQAARLTSTEWAQPALATCSAAQWAVLRSLGVSANCYAGHSFGEVMALHAAGAFDFDTALRIARRRGELMRDAAQQPGAMLALSLSIERVRELLSGHDELVVANHNAPQQIVVSGPRPAIENFEAALAAQLIAAKRLPVATAFHSRVVADAADGFAAALNEVDIQTPTQNVYANSSATLYPDDPAALRAQLAAQLAQPVRFVEMIEAMYADGVRTFLEVGAGSVLSGLVAAILGERPHRVIGFDRKGRDGVDSLLLGLARLAAAGVAMRPDALFADVRLPALPTRSKMAVSICGSNLGKPYPPLQPGDWPAANAEREIEAVHQGARSIDDQPTVGQGPPYESNLGATPYAPPSIAATATTSLDPLSPGHGGEGWGEGGPTPAPYDNPSHMTSHSPPAAFSEHHDMPIDPTAHSAWLTVFAEHQRQTAEAQASFQQALAESHAAYLNLASSSLAGLQALMQGQVLPAATMPAMAAPTQPMPAMATAPVAPAEASPTAMPALETHPAPATAAPTPEAAAIMATPIAATPAPAPQPTAPAIDLAALLLAVVADKTGYPVDMLNLDMDLEGDLGVDSIKRVEILAAVDERAPSLPKVDRARLGALHTLREIVDYLGASNAQASPAVSAAESATPAATAVAIDLPALLLSVVAEKTGYPVDMLNLDMDLEGDLGVDSIKRVEILAAVDERAPSLPKVDRARLGALHTLREIVDYLGADAGRSALEAVSIEAPLTTARQIPTSELGRYVVEPIAAPATGFSMPLLGSGERIWVVGPDAIASALVAELRQRKVNAQASTAPPEAALACIYLGGLIQAESRETAMAVNREAFALARRLAPRLQSKPGLFVTVQDSGGAFGFADTGEHQAWLAGLPALLKTCALEWPQTALKAIDIDRAARSDAELAVAIADELLRGGGEIEIGLSASGERRALHCVERTAEPAGSVITTGDVVLVSGGARGVTAACLNAWAAHCRPTLVLLGRTPLRDEPTVFAGIADEAGLKHALLAAAKSAGQAITPAELQAQVAQVLAVREIRANLATLREAGAEAHYFSAAVEQPQALDAVLKQVRDTHGPICGLIHAAGVLADKRIAEKTDAMFDRVFDTKVRGLAALLDATRDDPLTLLAVFSSVSARCGNTGQADYAMANEVLARVMHAEARRRPGLRVKSLGWGPWEGGMVSPQLKARFAELGVPTIPLDIGAGMFVEEMDDASAVELVLGGEPRPEALLSEGVDGRVEALELMVRRDSHGYLEGHAVNGEPVVPVVLAAEWLTRAARSLRPGRHLQALLDLKVLKGIRLHGFENGGDRLRIEARPVPGSQGRELQLLIRGASNVPHYSARAVLGSARALPGADLPLPSMQQWSGEPLYADLLFHRGEFELIESLDGISDEGVSATVRGVATTNWPGEAWQLDVAALDGGLQAAVIYGQRMLGGPNLPTSIGELRSFAQPTSSGSIRVTAHSRKVGKAATSTDIVFSDAGGQRLAELIDVQNHAF